MKVAIITIAGVSSRFNEGIEEKQKVLKCLYTKNGKENTILYRWMKRCSFADCTILVGGYKYPELVSFYAEELSKEFPKTKLVENTFYDEYSSGFSLYLGVQEALKYNPDEVVFIEGDLDVDNESFEQVVASKKNVLTYSFEPIFANKSVVLYKNENERYQYAFNSNHGMLKIDSPFSLILNSGQVWKFMDTDKLRHASDSFYVEDVANTNLGIIQRYVDLCDGDSFELIGFRSWTNCNTRMDYDSIYSCWRGEK